MAKSTTKQTRRSTQILTFTMRWFTICLLFGLSLNTRVNCQIDHKRQQESFHKYQQLQYQMQQQQQYQQEMQQQQQYQQEVQQQQQQYYLQQQLKQKEQGMLQPSSMPLQSNENGPSRSPTSQMLRTGASLVVAAESPELGQSENYAIDATQQITTARGGGSISGRKRKRRPENGAFAGNDENKQYWRGHVDDTTSSGGNNNSQEEANGNQKLRRRKQPAIREPLAALEKEQKLFEIRDKQRHGGGGDEKVTTGRDKSYRRPYSQAKKEQESITQPTLIANANDGKGVDLKHILKNSGGMSLSEILQKKNLSLDDLLKGKQNALLALQTTAEAPPSNQKTENSKNAKPSRRVPTTNPSESNNAPETNSNEHSSIEDQHQNGKNKLKFPTLNRIKLFGTSSRATAVPLPGSIETATKKREHISSTTTTAKPSTTTRLPIYKKRAQQRPTLKSLLRLKVSTESSNTDDDQAMKEASVIKQSNLSLEDDYDFDFDETTDDVDSKQASTTVETTTRDHVSVMTKGPTPLSSSTMTTARKAPTTPTPASTSTSTKSTTISTTATTRVTRRNRYGVGAKQRVRSKYRERFADKNLKSNSIEKINTLSAEDTQPQSNDSRETLDVDNTSAEIDDDLENFFEEETSPSPVTNKDDDDDGDDDDEDENTTIESITSRVDRTHRFRTPNAARLPSTTARTSTTATEPPLISDFDTVDDRTDILELIEDRHSGNRLFKVLQQRNMTLDQLIEHRKRGSSQLHLATVVDQNARSQFFPGQKVVLRDDIDIVTAFENFPHFNLLNLKSVKPDDIKTDSQGSSYFTSIVDIEPTDEIYKSAKDPDDGGDGSLRGPIYTQHYPRTEKSLSYFPSWKTLALASLVSTTKANPFFLHQPKLLLDESNSDESIDENSLLSNETTDVSNEEAYERKKVLKSSTDFEHHKDTAEDIENEVARAHDLLDLELSGHAFKRSPAASTMLKQQYTAVGNLYTNMPAGVRSAIAASAAIVLTSMATFLVIFVVCRLKQRKRSKTNYLRTYNSMKSKMTTTIAPAHTTTSLGKLSATSTTSNSRRSSLRNSFVEDLITSGTGASEVSASLMNIATISANTSPRPNELLFPRRDNITGHNSNEAILKTSTKNLFCGRRGTSLSGLSRCSYGGGGGAGGYVAGDFNCAGGDISSNNGGFNSMTGSTSSLALSLRSAQNVSSTKLNTMDPSSPEVQEYLFDNLRKSFN